MRRWCFILAAFVLTVASLGFASAQVSPAPSETPEGGPVLGSVTHGNTTVVFEAANRSDIQTQLLTTWDDFAVQHPAIARTLAFKPSLMNDRGYLNKHPELDAFFRAHPDVRDAMAADPGNFTAIPPRPGE
jgi:hypothetical protein